MNKSRSVRSGQNSEARAVVLSGQLPLQLGQQAVAVHQVREEEEQLRLGQGLAQTHLQQAGIMISVHSWTALTLFPTEKGMKCSSLRSLPSSSMNRSGLNTVPSPQWSPCTSGV